MMVNVRESRSDYPRPAQKDVRDPPVSVSEQGETLPPPPPPAGPTWDEWLTLNISDHSDPDLIPAPQLRTLLEKYKEVFRDLPPGLPPDRNIGHTIVLEEQAKAPYRRNRRMSPVELALCEEFVADLLHKGFIAPSNSPFGAPVMFIAKPAGGYRVVCDWRALNNITVKN